LNCLSFRQASAFVVLFCSLSIGQAAVLCRAAHSNLYAFDDQRSAPQNLALFERSFPNLAEPVISDPANFPDIWVDPRLRGWNVSREDLTFRFQAGAETVQTRPVFQSQFPYPELLGEVWSLKDEQFRFFNVGSRLLLKDADPRELADTLTKAVAENPGKNIQVPLDPHWALGREMINERQQWATTKGVDHYEQRKSYLSSEDQSDLRFHDRDAKNQNDLLVLTRDTDKDPLSMTAKEFYESTAAIVRIARWTGDEHWFAPMVQGGHISQHELPHAPRVRPELAPLLKGLWERLYFNKGIRVAEISRLNRFSQFPDPVFDAFLLKMFETAKVPGAEIDLLIFECDEKTGRRFRQKSSPFHRFQKLARISEDGAEMNEYLMYLDTHSEAFTETLNEMRAQSQAVSRQVVHQASSPKQWSASWEAPKNFETGSSRDKAKFAGFSLQKIRQMIREKNHPSGLTSQKATEIATWVSTGQQVPEALQSRLKRLNPAQLTDLRRSLALYSKELEDLNVFLHSKIGSRESVLIIGENADLVEFLLRSQSPQRNIMVRSREALSEKDLSVDNVVLLNTLSLLPTAEAKKQLISQTASVLKKGGRGFVVDFISPRIGDPPAKSVPMQLSELALSSHENQAPLGQGPLALALALRRQFLESTGSHQIDFDQIISWAKTARFVTHHYTVSEPLMGGKVLLLNKH